MSKFPFQLAVILGITLALFFAWDLSQRVVSGSRLVENEAQAREQLDRAKATQAALIAEKTRVSTNEYIEQKAREGGWSREGEQVFQPMVTPAPTPTATPRPFATSTPEPSWFETIVNLLIP